MGGDGAYALLRDLIVNRQIDVLVFYDRAPSQAHGSLIHDHRMLCLRAGIALYGRQTRQQRSRRITSMSGR